MVIFFFYLFTSCGSRHSRTSSYRKFKINQIVLLTTKHHIKTLKRKYRKNMVQKIIRRLEKNKALPEVSILKAMQMLVSTWNAVSTETIVNYFRKAGFSTANQEAAIADEDDLFKDLQNEIDALRNLQPDLVPEDANAASFTDVDTEVSTVQPPLTDSKILAEFFETDNISDVDDEVMDVSDGLEEEPMECPNKSDTCTGGSSNIFLILN